MNFNSIGYFQLDNILQSRVPCVLVNLDNIDLGQWYNSIIKMHLEVITLATSLENALTEIQNRKLHPSQSIIVIDTDGSKAESFVLRLEKEGYTNAFFIQGGFQQLNEERKKDLS